MGKIVASGLGGSMGVGSIVGVGVNVGIIEGRTGVGIIKGVKVGL